MTCEYVEKSSPMIFSPIEIGPLIGSPMDENPTVELEIGPPMKFVDVPSDQDVLSDEHVKKGSPMDIRERPSDENVREAITALLELTRCRCHHDWTGRGLHEIDCNEPWRGDVVVLVAAAGWTAPEARTRERYVRTTVTGACATTRTRNG